MQINLQKQYSRNGNCYQLKLPLETEYLIPDNEPVRLLNQVLEELNYEKLYLTYSADGRNPAVDPVSLFKVMVYAYSNGVYSSRAIERECRMNIAYMYLLNGQKTPDHNTINRFRNHNLKLCIEDLLTQFIQILSEQGEIQFRNLFIDGTKIEANANKYTFVWKKAVEKNEQKLQTNAARFLREELGLQALPDKLDAAFLSRELKRLHNKAKREGIIFVYGSGSRKTILQRQIEALSDYAERQAKYEYCNSTFGRRNSFSKTDRDATFMHMKEDYMRNGQLKPGYNVQVAVESEYIVGIDISAERSDVDTLIPFLNRLKRNYGRTFSNVVADAGYESEENYQYLKREEIKPFIKPSNYEYSKTKKFQRDMEFRLAMEYDRSTDTYTCKGNRKLTYRYDKKIVSQSGYVSYAKIYQCESCAGCPHYGQCYRGKYDKKLEVSPVFDALRAESRSNIESEEGIKLRVNRSIQAEGVFGVTKQDYGFTRFLTRGQVNVTTEYMLLAFGFNINKLHNRIQSGRIWKPLFELENTG